VYAAGNLTLVMLELLLHIDDATAFRALRNVVHHVTFPDDAVSILGEDVANSWAASPVVPTSQVAGDEWLETQSTLVLAVPSVIVPPTHRYDPDYITTSSTPCIRTSSGQSRSDLSLTSSWTQGSSSRARSDRSAARRVEMR